MIKRTHTVILITFLIFSFLLSSCSSEKMLTIKISTSIDNEAKIVYKTTDDNEHIKKINTYLNDITQRENIELEPSGGWSLIIEVGANHYTIAQHTDTDINTNYYLQSGDKYFKMSEKEYEHILDFYNSLSESESILS